MQPAEVPWLPLDPRRCFSRLFRDKTPSQQIERHGNGASVRLPLQPEPISPPIQNQLCFLISATVLHCVFLIRRILRFFGKRQGRCASFSHGSIEGQVVLQLSHTAEKDRLTPACFLHLLFLFRPAMAQMPMATINMGIKAMETAATMVLCTSMPSAAARLFVPIFRLSSLCHT